MGANFNLNKLRNACGIPFSVGEGQQDAGEFGWLLMDNIASVLPETAELFSFQLTQHDECLYGPVPCIVPPRPVRYFNLAVLRPLGPEEIDFQVAVQRGLDKVTFDKGTCDHFIEFEGPPVSPSGRRRRVQNCDMKHYCTDPVFGQEQRYLILRLPFIEMINKVNYRAQGRVLNLPTRTDEFTLPSINAEYRWKAFAAICWAGEADGSKG